MRLGYGRNANNRAFRAALELVVSCDDFEVLADYYAEIRDPEMKRYVRFYLEHMYRNEMFGEGTYYGKA